MRRREKYVAMSSVVEFSVEYHIAGHFFNKTKKKFSPNLVQVYR